MAWVPDGTLRVADLDAISLHTADWSDCREFRVRMDSVTWETRAPRKWEYMT